MRWLLSSLSILIFSSLLQVVLCGRGQSHHQSRGPHHQHQHSNHHPHHPHHPNPPHHPQAHPNHPPPNPKINPKAPPSPKQTPPKPSPHDLPPHLQSGHNIPEKPLKFKSEQEENAALKAISNKKSKMLLAKMNIIQQQSSLENDVMKAHAQIKRAEQNLKNAEQRVKNSKKQLEKYDSDLGKLDGEISAVHENRAERKKREAAIVYDDQVAGVYGVSSESNGVESGKAAAKPTTSSSSTTTVPEGVKIPSLEELEARWRAKQAHEDVGRKENEGEGQREEL